MRGDRHKKNWLKIWVPLVSKFPIRRVPTVEQILISSLKLRGIIGVFKDEIDIKMKVRIVTRRA